uniref:TIL domain-containing protein n=1 Tax=Isometrus maculatus TaxID=497827 RepID=A0A0U1SSR1_ISOMC|nr:hypothetical protein [Isometrus maculatus]
MKLILVLLVLWLASASAQIDLHVKCDNVDDCDRPCEVWECLPPSKCINKKCTCYPGVKIKGCTPIRNK